MTQSRIILIWVALGAALAIPIVTAATSPLLAWRDLIYIAAGFAGIVALALMLVQPLLAGSYLPGLSTRYSRRLHRITGGVLVTLVVLHVLGLWITSPPDVVDVLLFRSPTPFSVWGVLAMGALFATAILAMLRRPLRIRPTSWRAVHSALATVIVGGTIVHAVLIEGAMETFTKAGLCALVLLTTAKVFLDLRVWASGPNRGK